MYNKIDNRYFRATDGLKRNDFEPISDMKLYSKCINANVYLPVNSSIDPLTYKLNNVKIEISAGVLYLINVDVLSDITGLRWKILIKRNSGDIYVKTLNGFTAILNIDGTYTYSSIDVDLLPLVIMPAFTTGGEMLNVELTREYDIYEALSYNDFNNEVEDNYSLKNYFTAKNAMDLGLKNFKIVDLATTENIPDILSSKKGLIIDTEKVEIGHRVLVKDQNTNTENNIYVYTKDFTLVIADDLQTEETSSFYSVHVKLGSQKDQQWFNSRTNTGSFLITTDDKNFSIGHNRLVRHKLEYKNLNDLELHDISTILERMNYPIPAGIHNVSFDSLGVMKITGLNVTLPAINTLYTWKVEVSGHTNPIANGIFDITSTTNSGANVSISLASAPTSVLVHAATVKIYVDNRISIVVGEYGTIIKTFDDVFNLAVLGPTVIKTETTTRERLYALHISQDSSGHALGSVWICGKRGTILYSNDFGATYIIQSTPVLEDLNDIVFLDDMNGVAVGNKGTILYTTNAGLLWKDISLTNVQDMKDLKCMSVTDNTTVYVVGNRGTVLQLKLNVSNWLISKVPIFKQVDNITSYEIYENLNACVYNTITKKLSIGGDNLILFYIDLNNDNVRFIENDSTITALGLFDTIRTMENVLYPSNDAIFIAGNSFAINGANSIMQMYLINYAEAVLITDTNILSTVYNVSISFSAPGIVNNPFTSGYNDQVFNSLRWDDNFGVFVAVGNHTFYNACDYTGPSDWQDYLSTYYGITDNIFDNYKSKLIPLDYRLGAKMYFKNEQGDFNMPIILKNNLGNEVNHMSLDNSRPTTIFFVSLTGEHSYLDYLQTLEYTVGTTKINRNFRALNSVAFNKTNSNALIPIGSNLLFTFNADSTQIAYNATKPLLALTGDIVRVVLKETISGDLFLDDTFMVTAVSGNTITINQNFDGRFQNDLLNGIFTYHGYVNNINTYLEKDCTSLQTQVDIHPIGKTYGIVPTALSINTLDFKIVTRLTNKNKYYNLRTAVNTTVMATIPYNVDFVFDYRVQVLNFRYGPYYNLLNIMNDIDPTLFIPGYLFDAAVISKPYQPNPLVTTNFALSGNTFVIGSSYLTDWNSMKAGYFVDIFHNFVIAKQRVLITKKYSQTVNGITKYYLQTDADLQTLIATFSIVTSDAIDIRLRNDIAQISIDLARGNDLQTDIFAWPGLTVQNNPSFAYKNNLQYLTTQAYFELMSKNTDIKKNITGFIYSTDEHNLVCNLINIDNDPNLNYQPVDTYDIGIDRIVKTAISLDKKNTETEEIQVQTTIPLTYKKHTAGYLRDVDLTKFTFRLVDNLNLSILQQKYSWILDAEIEGAVIGEDAYGLVWYKGDWLCGTWKDGTWYSGTFHSGLWGNGKWYSREVEDRFSSVYVKSNTTLEFSKWLSGTWIDGTWNNGTWFDGTWQTGTWNTGLWLDGTWDSGTWNDGEWQGGDWINGVWNDGRFNIDNTYSTWYYGFWFGGDFENGLWVDGVFNQNIDKLSRFGTKSTGAKLSIWRHGSFIKGEIHSYANVQDGDKTKPLPSLNYRFTIWHSGTFYTGKVYGATFKQGNFLEGDFYRGYVDGGLPVVSFSQIRPDPIAPRWLLTLHVNNYKHYLKKGDTLHFIGLVGIEPATGYQLYLGTNYDPKEHKIYQVETNGDLTIEIINPSFTPVVSDLQTPGTTFYLNKFIAFTVEGGTFHHSLWNNGLWLNGYWETGMWNNGVWDNGVWMDINQPVP